MNSEFSVKTQPLLQVKELHKHFPVKSSLGLTTGHVKAVNGVSFDIETGQTFGLVGESGCGKSTLGRTILRLIEPTSGEAAYEGTNLFALDRRELRSYRQNMQMVFQDPYTSLDPRKRVGYSIEEPLLIHKKGNKRERTEIAMALLRKVGFSEEHYDRFPHEFSGGQRQRLGIAKALALGPKLLICDEPVSALDVSIQSQVINLLEEVQEELGIAYLFIAHDLSVVRHIADRIGVMYLGEMVEQAPTEALFAHPLHPYTKSLLSAVPVPDPRAKRQRVMLSGEIPSPLKPPSGCVFHTRCPYAMEACRHTVPERQLVGPNREVKCHLYHQ
ncbi:ABC transporter ATP-binding protein [Cohnella thermotolerans]|uniref:ABC transporter ATP-binding protein n=1 Tax=Cohnella thermotolerans TaxID=329858 RepID=UPI000429DA65|nr:dipeptide ABC transporter ATP-binding protein [Cohnella thermotolerans]